MRRLLLPMLAALTFMTIPLGAGAETVAQLIHSGCPNGTRITDLEKQIAEAVAMVDASSYALEKKLALEYYRCSSVTTDPYVKDFATFFYADSLFQAERTNRDTVDTSPTLIYKLNELAASTKYSDVKKHTLVLKAQVKADLDKVNAYLHPPVPASDLPTVPPDER